jgi:23S rRNA (cytosine1962-C5)-methyltransferase
VDTSADALETAAEIARLNGVDGRIEHQRGDVFEVLRTFRDEGRLFDVVIVDPPKLVRAAAGVDRGARAYKDVNRLAFAITRPGGYVATFSCSGLVSSDLFQKIVFSASIEAGREAQVIERFGPPDDHPVLLTFPEGDYLKGLGCRVW